MDESLSRLIVCSITIFLFCIVRSLRLKYLLGHNDFSEISWAIGGIVLTSSILVQAFANEALRNIIGLDGMLALLVGVGSQILSSFNEGIKEDCKYLFTIFRKHKK